MAKIDCPTDDQPRSDIVVDVVAIEQGRPEKEIARFLAKSTDGEASASAQGRKDAIRLPTNARMHSMVSQEASRAHKLRLQSMTRDAGKQESRLCLCCALSGSAQARDLDGPLTIKVYLARLQLRGVVGRGGQLRDRNAGSHPSPNLYVLTAACSAAEPYL